MGDLCRMSLPSGRANVSMVGAIAGVPDLLIAGAYLVTWIDPTLLPPAAPFWLLGVLLLEFAIIHSSGFMASVIIARESRTYRVVCLLALGAAYTLLVGIVARRFDASWMYVTLWLLTINKLLGVILGQAGDREREFIVEGWLAAFGLYMVAFALCAIVPLPVLGGTLLPQAAHELPAPPWWAQQPQRIFAWGFTYFMLLALSEATNHVWMDRMLRTVGGWAWGGLRRL